MVVSANGHEKSQGVDEQGPLLHVGAYGRSWKPGGRVSAQVRR